MYPWVCFCLEKILLKTFIDVFYFNINFSAEETIRRFEYSKFLKIRKEQRQRAQEFGGNLFHMKKSSSKKEEIFANKHMSMVTICATMVSFGYRHNTYYSYCLMEKECLIIMRQL